MAVNRRWYGPGCAVALLAVVLAGCADSAGTDPSSERAATSTTQPAAGQASPTKEITPTTEETGSPAPVGEGIAISVSDVEGQPDFPISSGEVLFFSGEQIEEIGEQFDFDPRNPNRSSFVFFQLDDAQLERYRGALTEIEDGRFRLDVPAGEYLVCLANIYAGHSLGSPYAVAGCHLAALSGGASLTVTHGEGGVRASVE